MRTTVRLEDGLLRRAKREARQRGVTLTSLIDRGLRLALANPRQRSGRKRVKLPVSRARGRIRPGVDLNDNSALLDRMEGLR